MKFGFADGVPVDIGFVSGDARRAFAFGFKMSPNELVVEPSENVGPVEFGAEETGVDSWT